MKQFPRSLVVLILLGAASCRLSAFEKAKEGDKISVKANSKGGDKGNDKSNRRKSGSSELNIPIPLQHQAQGVNIPYYDEKGKLQMRFAIVSATRVDENHLEMQAVNIETYKPDGTLEMSVDAKSSVLDLITRIVTSNEPASIRRSDFEITGDTMQFNTKTRDGNMSGNIRMLIYNTPNSEATAHE